MKIINFFKKNRGFLLGILVLLAFRWSLADQYRVPTGSMEPNIQVGDHIAVNKMAYDLKIPFTDLAVESLSNPQRGDIVVFIWPGDNSTIFVKRLIGLPGDHIQIQNGFLTINGQQLARIDFDQNQNRVSYHEKIGDHDFEVQRFPQWIKNENIDITVPEGSYFFMGDNRDNSFDSRAWGFVKRSALKGKALGVLWNIRFDQLIPHINLARIFANLS
ncbi:MAG: signal peptidase I [Bdellovibrio sp.]